MDRAKWRDLVKAAKGVIIVHHNIMVNDV